MTVLRVLMGTWVFSAVLVLLWAALLVVVDCRAIRTREREQVSTDPEREAWAALERLWRLPAYGERRVP